MPRQPDASQARPRALFLSPEPPYPPIGGGALRSASLLEYLGRRFDVDAILFRQPGEADPSDALPAWFQGRARVIQLPHHRTHAPARAWRNGRRAMAGRPPLFDRFSGFENAVVPDRDYDLGVIEHFWCAPYAAQLRPRCGQLWLDLHNIESALNARQAAGARGPEAWALARFALRYASMEREWLPRFDLVLAASGHDAAIARASAPSVNAATFPNTIPNREIPAGVPRDDSIVFSGNLGYHPNREAVAFFARHVWPRISAEWPGLRWRIVGKNADAVRGVAAAENHIEFAGPVEDAVAELARSKVAVVPLLSGSGTRVKILEAWAAGVPVVSTAVGAEGLACRAGEHVLIADGARAFAETVGELLASEALRLRVGRAGRKLFEERYTWEAGWEALDRALAAAG